MYLRKIGGLRSVTLKDGTVLTQADLPPRDTRRWVASRKALVVHAIEAGLITRDEALGRWSLSAEELEQWQEAIRRHGPAALRVTKSQQYRQP